MKPFSSIQDFHNRGNEDDRRELMEFIDGLTDKRASFPNDSYKFDYLSAVKELRAWGYDIYCFINIQDFRNRAAKEDYDKLAEFTERQTNKEEAFKKSDCYFFSYTSASGVLRSKGYMIGKQKAAPQENVTPKFFIQGEEKKDFTARSFSIQNDILERIDKLSDDNWQYSKKAIVNKLLDEALAKYGY